MNQVYPSQLRLLDDPSRNGLMHVPNGRYESLEIDTSLQKESLPVMLPSHPTQLMNRRRQKLIQAIENSYADEPLQ